MLTWLTVSNSAYPGGGGKKLQYKKDGGAGCHGLKFWNFLRQGGVDKMFILPVIGYGDFLESPIAIFIL